MRTPLLAILAVWLTATQAWSKVTSVTFEELARESEAIVVAKVERVTWPPIGKRYAKAKVLEVWKGAPTERVEFLTSRTWTCDISEAKKGETVLLFLTRSPNSRSYAIAHAGRGRMPLRVVEGQRYATFWPEVRLPKDIPTIHGPEAKWDFIKSVELGTLRALVKKALTQEERPE